MNFEDSAYSLLLLGAVSSVLTQGYKYLVAKFGKELTKYGIYLGVFVISIVWVVLLQRNIISTETIKYVTEIFFIAIGVYEVILKRLDNILQFTTKKIAGIFKKK